MEDTIGHIYDMVCGRERFAECNASECNVVVTLWKM